MPMMIGGKIHRLFNLERVFADMVTIRCSLTERICTRV